MKIPFKTKAEIPAEISDEIFNGYIEELTVGIVGHFGSCVVVSMPVIYKDGAFYCNTLSGYGLTRDCGYVIKALYELFDLIEDDLGTLDKFKNLPCRVVVDGDIVIGVGHFMKDKFLLFDDILQKLKENER